MIWISSEFISNCITRPPVKNITCFQDSGLRSYVLITLRW